MAGKFYTTDDLIKMGQMGHFGNYSPVVTRALLKLKNLELENQTLRETIESYQKIDLIKENYDEDSHTVSMNDMENNY